MELTKEQVERINVECPYGQGVFQEPFGIPSDIKGLVIYTKWESAGRPGSCWDDDDTVNEEYENDRPEDAFVVLDKVLKVLKPDISPSEYKKIEALKKSNEEIDYGFYGDYTEDTIEWIELDDLIKVISSIY